jgi:type I restriction enzyme S subunit
MSMEAWPIKRLDELCEVTSSKRIYASELCTTGVPFFRSKEIIEKLSGQAVPSNPLFISEKRFQEIRQLTGAPTLGDVLLTSRGTLGVPYLVNETDRFHFADGNLTWFRSFQDLDSRYLKYYFVSPPGKAELSKCVIGSSQAAYTIASLKKVQIPLPPVPVQRRIAGILSAYDELIENSQRRIRLLEDMARALYREWFVHFRFPGHESVPRLPSALGDIPQGWEVKKLGDLTAYLNRGLSPSYDDNADTLVINQKCIRDQRLSLEPARRQSKPIPPDKLVRFGDVLINSTGVGTLGRVAQVYQHIGECSVDTHVTIARPRLGIDVDFFGCALLSNQETFERLGIGATGQTELGRPAISNVDLVVPPESLQARFGPIVRPMRTATIHLANKIQNLRRTRDLLLPRLLSGQVELST